MTNFDIMTNFQRLVFWSIIWLLATVCDTLIAIRENHWLLRIIWTFSKSMSEYEPVFPICVWIKIHVNTLSSFHAAFVLVAALKTNRLLLNILIVFQCYLFTRMLSKISYHCTSLFFLFLLKITFIFFVLIGPFCRVSTLEGIPRRHFIP